MRTASWLVLALLAGCGSGNSPAPDAGGASCIAAGSDHFCSTDHGCCAGAFCDSVTGYCRDGAACGVPGQSCDGDGVPACCEGLDCEQGRCEPTVQGTATTGGGNGSAGTSATSGSCGAVLSTCFANADCCSGHCALGNNQCAAPTTGGGNTTSTSATTSSGTTGGTCSGPGAGCSASTDCCSGRCNSGVCG
jgi:hypothetical protein